MNEYDLLKRIEKHIGNDYIGDDCAYLRDLHIVVTQDSLAEDIHFKREWITPYQLGYKSIAVNISDILASGAEPKYLTIALSIPDNINSDYIEQFYEGAKSASNGMKIVGGDITAAKDKIVISVTAIGSCIGRNISSRKNANDGYIIVTNGIYGASSAGLSELINGGSNSDLINSHLMPKLNYEFSDNIAKNIKEPYAMMDTSDGIADALFKIAEASNIKIVADYNKIPHLMNFSKEQVLFGGEDYNLVAAIPAKYEKIAGGVVIGYAEKYDGIRLNISGDKYTNYHELSVYQHFEENNE